MTTIEDIRKLGFKDAPTEAPRRLIVNDVGPEKEGKTHWALTAPGPIFLLSTDIGDEGVVEKFTGKGKEILKKEIRFSRNGDILSLKEEAVPLWIQFRENYSKILEVNEGSLIVDTASDAYELSRLSHFGKLTQVMPQHYNEVNAEWRALVRDAYDSKMNVIFIHRLKSVWKDGSKTDDLEIAGMGEMPYLVQANVLMARTGNKFKATVENCRQNPDVNGMVLEDSAFDFNFLLSMVHA